ncbi:CBS domain-containing protein [Vreelandella populi]|uniref:CBS domain-containing protein n=1 Tax=Vreelandella populi TaxID=2498858 RepID=A0A3S0WQN0_9GAMM|nr:CBS domain-containing protein [Halomonas populi]RUR40923.1 CBS domain-containing protein [Halomonas populi]RUR49434.1 CBS domain-containing protein [Halomonas populi]RUR55917.1 CBS domain-containing protein [Halomonas populi]
MRQHTPHTVRDIMSRDCYRVSPATSITNLAQGLALHRLPGAPVVDSSDRLIGFISEQDVIGRVLDCLYHDHETPLVHELMRQEVLTTTPNKCVTDLAQEMMGNKPKVYPVVEQQRLVGIVTRRDILLALLTIRCH